MTRTYYITNENLLEYLFNNEDEPQENERFKIAFAEEVQKAILEKREFKMNSQWLLDNVVNIDAVRLKFLEEFQGVDTDMQIIDIKGKSEIKILPIEKRMKHPLTSAYENFAQALLEEVNVLGNKKLNLSLQGLYNQIENTIYNAKNDIVQD